MKKLLLIVIISLFMFATCDNPFWQVDESYVPSGGGTPPGGNTFATIIPAAHMAFVAGGTVNVNGSPVTVNDYYMGKYLVTQQLYQRVMANNPSIFKSAAAGENANLLPVENVSWFDAIEFCNKLSALEGRTPAYTITGRTPSAGYPIMDAVVTVNSGASGYRLPTEAEWVWACQGRSNTAAAVADNTGWYITNSANRTHEVGKKSPNTLDIYDMLGNVWEWCWNTTGTINRVSRGGGWSFDSSYATSSYRGISTPDDPHQVLGFRVVRE